MMQPGKEVGGAGRWAGSYITGRGTNICGGHTSLKQAEIFRFN